MQRLRLGSTKVPEMELKELQVGSASTRRVTDFKFPADREHIHNYHYFNIFYGTGSAHRFRPMGQLFMCFLERNE